MIPKMRSGRARLPMLAAGITLVSMMAAAAQTPPASDEAETQEAEETEAAPSVNDVDIMKDIDVSKLDWSLLNVDASTLTALAPKGSAASKGADKLEAAWTANEMPNGTSAVSVKQSISPFWDTRIGADMTLARQGTATNPNCSRKSSPMAAACRNRPAPPGRRSRPPALARSGIRPRSKPASIPGPSRAGSAPP
jgi:hypothetical protein